MICFFFLLLPIAQLQVEDSKKLLGLCCHLEKMHGTEHWHQISPAQVNLYGVKTLGLGVLQQAALLTLNKVVSYDAFTMPSFPLEPRAVHSSGST